MAKRNKRLKKGIESIKEEIEKHFKKLDNDLSEAKETVARYHIKEISLSLIQTLEKKIKSLGKITKEDLEQLNKYKSLLEEYKNKLSIKD